MRQIRRSIKRNPVGSISTGTLRAYDLFQSFSRELRHRDPVGWHQAFDVTCGFGPLPSEAETDESHPFWESEDSDHLIEMLTEALEGCAPEGFYFGSHPGDGADFGYWSVDDVAC